MVFEKKQLSKKILAVALAIATAVTFMPMFGGFSYAAENAAVVTTADGSASYDSLEKALSETLINNTADATITLNEDAVLDGDVTVNIPLVIALNGHTITGAGKLLPAAGAMGIDYTGFCCKAGTDEIVFAQHEIKETVYNWAQRANGAWYVASKTVTCANCGDQEVAVAESATTPAAPAESGDTTYEYKEGGKVVDSKFVEGKAPAVYSDAKVTIVQVNKVNQHKDGVPVVKATVKDSSIKDDVEAKATVTAATDKELAVAGVKVYDENGAEVAKPAAGFKAVQEPTCTTEGKAIYKVVVTAPDNNEFVVYVQDSQAAAKTGHIQGKLKGIRFLEKHEFSSQAAAAADSAYANRVGEVETETVGTTTKYVFWAYATEVKPVDSKLTLAAKYVKNDGSFTYVPVYYCLFEEAKDSSNVVVGDAVTVKPYADAATAAEAADGAHSLCTEWVYPKTSIVYEYYKDPQKDTVKSKETASVEVYKTAKVASAYSHKNDGSKYEVKTQPTCSAEGVAVVKCAVCGNADDSVTEPIAKLADTFGVYNGTTPVKASDLGFAGDTREATLNADKTEATLTATCEKAGGVYQWCTGENNGTKGGHWVLKEAAKATGHTLDNKVVEGAWSANTNSTYAATNDYVYEAQQSCSNPNCEKGASYFAVRYHSVKTGTPGELDKYGAVEITDEKVGADCQTEAKTVYTVKGLTDRSGKPITKEVKKGAATVGDHVYEATGFNWSKDYEAATVTAKCTVKGCGKTNLSQKATVTKATEANGITTYTAKYGDKTESKKVYTLKDAKVSYDAAQITDGNLVEGIEGAAAQTPEVKVELNGTVIDNSKLKETWTFNATTKEVKLTVSWADSVTAEGVDAKTDDTAAAKTIKVAGKNVITKDKITVTVKDGKKSASMIKDEDGEEYYSRDYNPEKAFSVSAKAADVKSATVKYAISEEMIEAEDEDASADVQKQSIQKQMEALDYSLDAVNDIKDAGEYYVYAQIKADGYTTYTGFLAEISIDPLVVVATCDGATFTEGEDPEINIVFRESTDDGKLGKIVNIDKNLVKVVSEGGKELKDLKPGKYYILVTADNYDVDSSSAQVTVLAKDGKTAEEKAAEEAKARQAAVEAAEAAAKADEAAAAAVKEADEAAAKADAAKADADAAVAAAQTDAEKAAAAAKTVEAAKAAAAAETAAKTAAEKADAAKAANDAPVAAAKKAYGADSEQVAKAQEKADAAAKVAETQTAAVKAASEKAAAAKAAADATKMKTTIKVKPAKKTLKAKKLKKKALKFKLKATVNSKAKATFKLAKKNKKVKVSKTGKVTVKKGTKKGTYKVKIKVTTPATDTYKAGSKTVTLKIKVK